MNYQQLAEEIFDDYEQKHRDILSDVLANSQQIAERILAKYDTSKLSSKEIDELKKTIVKKEVDGFVRFIKQNEDVLDADLSDKQKFEKLFARYDSPTLTNEQRELLKRRIRRHIYDNEVCKILAQLADDLNLTKKN